MYFTKNTFAVRSFSFSIFMSNDVILVSWSFGLGVDYKCNK
jgi:hypothetical protein